MAYPRVPTEPEWLELHRDFPQLNRPDVLVEGPPTVEYNCIAWALGYTDRWINPPVELEAFVDLFLQEGHPRDYERRLPALSTDATCDGYGTAESMTHASRYDLGVWSSKLGQSMRISHNRDGVEGDLYGLIIVSFC